MEVKMKYTIRNKLGTLKEIREKNERLNEKHLVEPDMVRYDGVTSIVEIDENTLEITALKCTKERWETFSWIVGVI